MRPEDFWAEARPVGERGLSAQTQELYADIEGAKTRFDQRVANDSTIPPEVRDQAAQRLAARGESLVPEEVTDWGAAMDDICSALD